jgi:hydrogenase/urease accessory protein HupE
MPCAWRRQCRRVLRRVAAAALVICFCTVSLRAHEIGTTRVSVDFADDGTYQIEIVTDAAALVEKLEASSGSSSPADTQADRLQNLLRSFDETFRKRVNIAFDDVEVQPTATYSVTTAVDNSSAASATIRLKEQTPSDAKHFTWTYSWTFASYALTVRRAPNESAVTEWLEGNQRSAPLALSVPSPPIDRLGIAWRYLTLGFTHIVPKGLDHVLFVLGIYLLSTRARSVLWQVSAFTVAHSITLGLSIYGVLAVPPAIVEPLIALSIAYVAVENILVSELKSRRVALVFAFGLLHGMGFAGALQELGLPRSEFVTALVTFNLGVEAGQLAVIGAAFLLVGFHWSHRAWYRTRIVVPVSALIACLAVYWTIARLQP